MPDNHTADVATDRLPAPERLRRPDRRNLEQLERLGQAAQPMLTHAQQLDAILDRLAQRLHKAAESRCSGAGRKLLA